MPSGRREEPRGERSRPATTPTAMSLVFDEYGRPFIIMREQEKKTRLKGISAARSNILAARTVSNVLRSSLGPKGMDKMIICKRLVGRASALVLAVFLKLV